MKVIVGFGEPTLCLTHTSSIASEVEHGLGAAERTLARQPTVDSLNLLPLDYL